MKIKEENKKKPIDKKQLIKDKKKFIKENSNVILK
jgi:hypothetical protein